jgi:transcription elongation factor GreA
VALSAEGRANLQARLEILQEERISVVADIQRAMADKDFRENAPLDAAKERQGKIEADIRELEHTLARAVLRRDGEVSATVRLGNTVRLKEISTGKVMQYRLVDAAEADPSAGKLSSSSPVGRALLQKAVGEEVSVSAPRGTMIYKIEEVAV